MKILVINSGSSSIKYRFFDTKIAYPLCRGVMERIGSGSSSLTHQRHNQKPTTTKVCASDHNKAIGYIFETLTSKTSGVITSFNQISGIGHRVVHGAEIFSQPTIINDKVIKTLEKFSELAPLHNPPALLGIRACRRFAKNIPQVAVFDTAFHQTIPQYAYTYGIPYEFYKNLGIRKYGFHGTSHKFVAQQAAVRLKKNLKKLKIITCHLGNGCSITAVKNGKSIDTSMGFTPLEGLLMGTRCGDLDPAVAFYIMEKRHISPKDMDNMLNKKSGLLGLSGVSNDMRDVLKAAASGNLRARLAIEIFTYRIKKYIGAYAAAMDGLDAVILTAGIGEHVPVVKKAIARGLRKFLHRFNAKILVIPTNEELMIARETAAVISRQHG